jgi:hypothetical protein
MNKPALACGGDAREVGVASVSVHISVQVYVHLRTLRGQESQARKERKEEKASARALVHHS